MIAPTRCAGRLIYVDHHAEPGDAWVLDPPGGGRLAFCSWYCLLEHLCEPPPLFPDDRQPQPSPRRQRHLELVR